MADRRETRNPLLFLLLGRWMGHPLFPAVAHLPIAMWAGALLFDVLNCLDVWPDGGTTNKGAYYLLLGGLATLVVVLPAELAEWSQFRRASRAWTLAACQFLLNLVAAGLFLGSMLRRGSPSHILEGPVDTLALGLGAAGVVVLAVAAVLGGRLTYIYGMGTRGGVRHAQRPAGGTDLTEAK